VAPPRPHATTVPRKRKTRRGRCKFVISMVSPVRGLQLSLRATRLDAIRETEGSWMRRAWPRKKLKDPN